jgi:hypothetical protein
MGDHGQAHDVSYCNALLLLVLLVMLKMMAMIIFVVIMMMMAMTTTTMMMMKMMKMITMMMPLLLLQPLLFLHITLTCSFVACAAYSMHITGSFNDISSTVSALSLDHRLLLSLSLAACCAAIQALIFPPSRDNTGPAHVRARAMSCA